MSRRRQQSENALFIFCLLKNTIQPLGAKDFDLNQGAKLEYYLNCVSTSMGDNDLSNHQAASPENRVFGERPDPCCSKKCTDFYNFRPVPPKSDKYLF